MSSDWAVTSKETRCYRILERAERAVRVAVGVVAEKATSWGDMRRKAVAGWKKQRIQEIEAWRGALLKEADEFKRSFLAGVFASLPEDARSASLQKLLDKTAVTVLQLAHGRIAEDVEEASQREAKRVRELSSEAQSQVAAAADKVSGLAEAALADAERKSKAAAPAHTAAPLHAKGMGAKRPAPIDVGEARKKPSQRASSLSSPDAFLTATPSPLTAILPSMPSTRLVGATPRPPSMPMAGGMGGRSGSHTTPRPLRTGSFLKMSRPKTVGGSSLGPKK